MMRFMWRVAWAVAAVIACILVVRVARNHTLWSGRERPLVEQIGQLENLPSGQRAATSQNLAREIAQLPPGVHKVQLATRLAELSVEGDLGYETVQSAATTLAAALRQNPVTRVEAAWNRSGVGASYMDLAELVRYEHVTVSLSDPSFTAALANVDQEDRDRSQSNFTLPDTTGNPWTLRNLRGRVVLVNFWATWCPPCREELPDLDAVYEQLRGRGLVVLGITDEEPQNVASFLSQHPLPYPVLIDRDRKVNELFHVEGIPKTFVYDRQGKLVAEAMDMRTRRQFLGMLQQAGLQQ